MPRTTVPTAIDCDVLVVGGGINGCGIARDLAGRGWRVVLCEQDDLAAHTSSSSTKLIHGGLRYLEHREFALVRKALQEREVLMRGAPHLVRPLRFVMPHDPSMRPAWVIRIGLFLYDHLARRELLPGSRAVDLQADPVGAPLKSRYERGFAYSDGWVDDARLVVACAIDARDRDARILTRTRCVEARRDATGWSATLATSPGSVAVRARVVINATGPWADAFLRGVARTPDGAAIATRRLRLVKGSHIVVARRLVHDTAYLLQSPDKRVVFAIPYEDDYTLIGTTDVELDEGDPGTARASDDEIAYLCAQANRYFRDAVHPSQVAWTYSGVRPLLDDDAGDPAAITRDYLLEADVDEAPLLTVWGGKITTFRKLAEEAGDAIGRLLGTPRPSWTRSAFLAGGDLAAWIDASTRGRPDRAFAAFVAAVEARYPWLDRSLALRLARAYGARIERVLGAATSRLDLGDEIAPDLYERELRYLVDEEWAVDAEDVLWRRSKLGLHLAVAQRRAVDAWMQGTVVHAEAGAR